MKMYFSTQIGQCMITTILFIIILLAEPSTNLHLHRGDEFYKACDNENALNEYQLARQLAPSDYYCLLRLVRINNDIGRLKLGASSEAEQYYKKSVGYADSLVTLYPDSAESHFWYALAKGSLIPFVGIHKKIQIGREVKHHVDRALRIDSTFSYPYVIKGIFEREGAQLSWFEKGIVKIIFGEDLSGSLCNSEKFLHKAIVCDSTNSYAYFELFWTYKAMNDTTRAIASLQKVLNMTANNMREQNQLEESRKYLREITRQ